MKKAENISAHHFHRPLRLRPGDRGPHPEQGAFRSILGEASGDTTGMSVRDIILNAAGQTDGSLRP